MDKETGNPLTVNDQEVTATKTFTPDKADGSVDLTFVFDGSALAGKSIVAFEDVQYEGKSVGTHADINVKTRQLIFRKSRQRQQMKIQQSICQKQRIL